jgi:predicted nuclease with TOPRIM domain
MLKQKLEPIERENHEMRARLNDADCMNSDIRAKNGALDDDKTRLTGLITDMDREVNRLRVINDQLANEL